MKKEYTNGEITVFWNSEICKHSGNCVRGLYNVFNPKAKPWINMDRGNSDEIMKVIDTCPSKALTYTKKETE